MTPLQQQIADLLYPLADFYAEHGDALPRVTPVEPDEMPPPYRELLVHERDMTSTLTAFFGSALHLKVLDKRVDETKVSRQVVLMTDADQRPTEFGAIRIWLTQFPPAARADVIACRLPLGAILDRHQVEYTCQPSAFFRFESDAIARHAFGIDGARTLFGRHNTLLGGGGTTIAEVVEILPPLGDDEQRS